MPYQSKFNGYVAYKAQSGLGSQASGSGGTVLRQRGGTPGSLGKAAIASNEVRRDAQRTRGRHGMQTTKGGPYDVELSLGAMDAVLAAVMRGSWDSEFSKSASDFTSLTTPSSHVIALTSGNPISMGFRVGEIIRLGSYSQTADNDRNLRITGLSTSSITVAETLTVNTVADTDVTITRVGRKIIMPAAGSLVDTYFTVEEYDADIDASRIFTDCRWDTIKLAMTPNELVLASPSFMGTGQFDIETDSSAPLLTSPTTPAGVPLAVLDAVLRIGGVDVVDLTSFDLTLDTGAVAPAVAAAKVSPAVMPGQNKVSMNLKFLRKDTGWDADFLNETGLSLSVLLAANTDEPKDFVSINVPYFTLGSADLDALSTDGGAREMSISIPAELVGSDPTGSGYDATMMSVQISNAS